MTDLTARLGSDAPTLHVAETSPPQGEVRFTPGSVVADRYRIVSLLGRGGMGEVYRAEDLRLDQPVALKYLPAPSRDTLDRLYAEVRLGRQISHPNVCRLYDIIEVGGHHFIAMEYVDGEDLASLLRRVGKLPAAKVVQIARDVFAGLAAVHDHGVVHRDLKPANVMLDSRGRARLTDFGLAAIAAETRASREIAGTPAYMSPEQISGDRVTPRSDLYSMALVLYELFTGHRLFEASTLAEIATKHNQPKPRLTPIVPDLDPAIDRIVLRCLEEEPDERPASAREVLAAFPETDPLAALVRAGETPSPALIAAAGEEGTISQRTGAMLVIAAVIGLLAVAYVSPRGWLWGRVETKSFEVLADRANDVIRNAGYDPKALYTRELWHRVPPRTLFFVLRFDTNPIVALNSRRRVSLHDPPSDTGGRVVLDPQGRLMLFEAPGKRPIEATPNLREILKKPPPLTSSATILGFVQPSVLFLALIFGIRNLRSGRTDRRGAVRIALVALMLALGWGFLNAHHTTVPPIEWPIVTDVAGTALYYAAQMSVLYLAIEPFLRRRMPHALIGWTRLLAGRWRDPLVGRDVLVGVVAGLFITAFEYAPYALFDLEPIAWSMRHLDSGPVVLAHAFSGLVQALYFGLGITATFVGLRAVLGARIAPVVFIAFMTLVRFPTDPQLVAFAGLVLAMAILAFTIIRFGLLAFIVASVVIQVVFRLPVTLDMSAWYAGRTMLVMAAIGALAVYGFRYATSRTPQWMYGASDSATARLD